VAAPVFKRIAEQVLPHLDVPRDVADWPAARPGRVQESRSIRKRYARRFHADGFLGTARPTSCGVNRTKYQRWQKSDALRDRSRG